MVPPKNSTTRKIVQTLEKRAEKSRDIESGFRLQGFHLDPGDLAGFGVGAENGGEIGGFKIVESLQSVFNDSGNRKKRNLPCEEARHRHFVSRIVYRGGDAPGAHGGMREPQ